MRQPTNGQRDPNDVLRGLLDKPAAPTRVDAMLLTDELGGGRQTRVRYLSRQPREVPAQWLNPMFLARNASLD